MASRVPGSKTPSAAAQPHSGSATTVKLGELLALAPLARSMRLQPVRQVAQRSGGHVSSLPGRGVDYRESRAYQAGDDVRHIDWRVTARTGKTHTKIYQEEREQALLLVVDFNPSMRFGTRQRLKSVQAARVAALLAWLVTAAGDRVGVLGYGGGIDGELRPVAGQRGALRVLRWLRDADAAAGGHSSALATALPRLRHVARPGSRLLLLSDGASLDDASWAPLAGLSARHDLRLVHLCDALELETPPAGRYSIVQNDRHYQVDLSDPRQRVAWRDWFDTRRAELARRCRQARIGLHEVRGDDDLRVALSPLLRRGPGSAP